MYRIRMAAKQGRRHRLNGTNNQDAVLHGAVGDYTFGVICDGCSEGAYSEVGAWLGANFIYHSLRQRLARAAYVCDVPIATFHKLKMALDTYTEAMLPAYSGQEKERAQFVRDHLLFTVLGFIQSPDAVLFFWAGDGTIWHNDDTRLLKQDDRPTYLGYSLVHEAHLSADIHIPTAFEIFEVPTDGLARFAIGSDAWHVEQPMLSLVWGYEHPSGLQRQLNVWSDQVHQFHDDVSIITAERE